MFFFGLLVTSLVLDKITSINRTGVAKIDDARAKPVKANKTARNHWVIIPLSTICCNFDISSKKIDPPNIKL